jgi:hypothetical protein
MKLPYLDMVFIEVFKTNHDSKFFILFYSAFSQILLIPFMNDLAFSYLTKLQKKTFNYGYFNKKIEYYKRICHYSIVDNC